MLPGEKILKLSSKKESQIDFTTFEASRYDKPTDYNPYYECKMERDTLQ